MFGNYFKTAFRNLVRNKAYAFITISGLAIGMAVCILLLLYVRHETSYDRFHRQADHIYRLCQPRHPFHAPQTAGLLADNLPEIRDYARILVSGDDIIQYKDKKYFEKIDVLAYADASLFRVFSFRFRQGDPEKALQQPYTVVISEKAARKYFGRENPLGKVLKFNHETDYVVTGVMADMPDNSHFRYDLIATLTAFEKVAGAEMMNNWGWENFLVYFVMREPFSRPDFEKKCRELMGRLHATPNSPPVAYSLQQLKDIHLRSDFENDIQPQNSFIHVLIFAAIGLLILLIACFNYVNLLTANAMARAKEIGIRKVAGATRRHLAMQFIGESFLVLFLALLVALLLVAVCLPAFNGLAGKRLSFAALAQAGAVLDMLAMVMATGFLAGAYPAFFLATRQPTKALQAGKNTGRANFNFRKLLVGAQFTVVIILISSALFMSGQIRFLQSNKLGFNKDYILTATLNHPATDAGKFDALKQALRKESAVKSVSIASRVPSDSLSDRGTLVAAGQSKPVLLPFVHVHGDYFETLGVRASRGRLFSGNLKSDAEDALVLNEAAVKRLAIRGNPVGQSVDCSWPKSKRKIVGVVADFHFESLYRTIQPVVFVPDYSRCRQLMVKTNAASAAGVIRRLEAVGNGFYPDEVFEFRFLDDRLNELYRQDRNSFRTMGYFTVLAVFIACMGLYGLGMAMIKSRTREIGVRKVLGASVTELFLELTGDFSRWVVLANIVACPIAYYAMRQWLQNFAYRIDLTAGPFVLAGAAAWAIALLTVSWQTVKAARINPVESLRCE